MKKMGHFMGRSILRIPYRYIGPRVPNTWRPPFLSDRWLLTLGAFPQNLLSLVNPTVAFKMISQLANTGGHDFGVIYDENVADCVENQIENHHPIGILIVDTHKKEVFQHLAKMFRKTFITAFDDNVAKELKADPVCNDKFLDFDPIVVADEIRRHLPMALRMCGELMGDPFPDEIIARMTAQSELIKRGDQKMFYDFAPCYPNYLNIAQIKGWGWNATHLPKKVEHHRRIRAAIRSVKKLDINHWVINQESPPLILTFPFINRREESIKLRRIRNEIPAKAKPEIFKLMRGFKIEQSKDYLWYFDQELESISGLIIRERSKHLAFLDNMQFLHSGFRCSPSLRVPAKGASIYDCLAPFEPREFRRNYSPKGVFENISKLGEKLAESIPSEYLDILRQAKRQMVVISDLPIEWLMIDGVPLGFKNDVCRLPENPGATVMTQFAVNSQVFFSIPSEILKKTLVVCLSPGDDEILRAFQNIKRTHESSGVRFETCRSMEHLKQVANESDWDLIIYFSHGSSRKDRSDSVLLMDGVEISGQEIIDNGLSAPLVVLFACEMAPLFGYLNPSPRAFFEAGAMSVVTTILPISINSAFLLCNRILINLSTAAKTKIHHNWLDFVSHNLRTSLFEDMIHRILDSNKLSYLIPKMDYEKKAPWLGKAMNPLTRVAAYKELSESVSRCFPVESRPRVKDVLDKNEFLPEGLFFSIWGRADLIPFDSWSNKLNIEQNSGYDSSQVRE
ncbi:MAG: CHAT domain-containing protein [Elusimicrobia bacterium]|nr:CHAT domain-containing protein [Elusimicrobiota bacterium]